MGENIDMYDSYSSDQMANPVDNSTNINPTADIYKILDQSGMTLSHFHTAGVTTKSINDVRVELAEKLKVYIMRRDQEMIARGKNEVMS